MELHVVGVKVGGLGDVAEERDVDCHDDEDNGPTGDVVDEERHSVILEPAPYMRVSTGIYIFYEVVKFVM